MPTALTWFVCESISVSHTEGSIVQSVRFSIDVSSAVFLLSCSPLFKPTGRLHCEILQTCHCKHNIIFSLYCIFFPVFPVPQTLTRTFYMQFVQFDVLCINEVVALFPSNKCKDLKNSSHNTADSSLTSLKVKHFISAEYTALFSSLHNFDPHLSSLIYRDFSEIMFL